MEFYSTFNIVTVISRRFLGNHLVHLAFLSFHKCTSRNAIPEILSIWEGSVTTSILKVIGIIRLGIEPWSPAHDAGMNKDTGLFVLNFIMRTQEVIPK